MRKSLRSKIHYVFFGADTLHIPLILGLIAMAWGIILWLQGSTFTTGQSYRIMAQIMTEGSWAGLMFFIGALQIVAALQGWHWKVQTVTNALSMALWLSVSIVVFQANLISAHGAVYPFLTLLAYGRLYRCLTERENL